MKKIFGRIFGPIANFFNRMADQKAERTIEMYRQIFEVKARKGGGWEKITINVNPSQETISIINYNTRPYRIGRCSAFCGRREGK